MIVYEFAAIRAGMKHGRRCTCPPDRPKPSLLCPLHGCAARDELIAKLESLGLRVETRNHPDPFAEEEVMPPS